jgi:hypothetical protein
MQKKHRTRYQKFIAAFMLTIMSAEILTPNIAYALTSGPAAPETSSFQQAGVTDMVDLFTGNMNYNLPVMDVDGYPLNLSYGSGSGMDDEASWVGLGWNLHVGSVTRQLRGLPDDMSGDNFQTEHYTKPKVTVGGRLTGKLELKGASTDLLKLSGSFTLGVFSDNYTGIGAELGANAGISYSFTSGGSLTAGMGVGLLASTASGVDVTPSLSLSYTDKINKNSTQSFGISASLGYNTRAGLKALTLGSSYSLAGSSIEKETGKTKSGSANYDLGGATISYNTEPINPDIQIPYRSTSGSFSFDIGGAAWLIFGGVGGTGYKSVREVKDRVVNNPAFGFLYAERGKNNPAALMDMQREKESMVIPELPNLAVPVHTPDLFSYTSQAGSGQFRLYRGGSGIFFDNEVKETSSEFTAGFDAGIGAYAHGGVSFYTNTTKNITKKWTDNNAFNGVADFQDPYIAAADLKKENVFFKQVGEKNLTDQSVIGIMGGKDPVAVNISGKAASATWYKGATRPPEVVSNMAAPNRVKRRQGISYLTAEDATKAALDQKLKSYDFINFNQSAPFQPIACHGIQPLSVIDRQGSYRKNHHISELTVTDENGKRNVYGLPVYNVSQTEYSFAIGNPDKYAQGAALADVTGKNLVPLPLDGSGNIVQNTDQNNDHYYHKEKQPAYANSYLLTGILSPDYVDVTNNGITDDDLGTAIKFNYSKKQGLYKWRTPYNAPASSPAASIPKASINKGLLADPDDDKASFVIGEKELWYVHSIETKTKIAYFITEDRKDALGVMDLLGRPDATNRQKVLREIRLYSKADITRPIKVVKFEYTYDLCKNIPNQVEPGAGKLTLKKVIFLYGNSPKGNDHPYVFHYNNEISGGTYDYLSTDRWGTYKPQTSNSGDGINLRNDEFPYASQNKANADLWAGAWQLSKISLPTGGEINVQYESDDYAYVQNKKAMKMIKPKDLIKVIKDVNGNTTSVVSINNLRDANAIELTAPGAASLSLEDFKTQYLAGSAYLYTKLFVDLRGYDSKGKAMSDAFCDFVSCYAKVVKKHPGTSSNTIILEFESIEEGGETANPIQIAAWQKMKMEYPRYSYPGYKNRIDHTTGVSKAIEAALGAVLNAAKTLNELTQSFYERASRLKFAQRVNLQKSYVRIGIAKENEQDIAKKLGGGSRVKKILISDNWNTMTGSALASAKVYGQAYEYTTTDLDKNIISSGVASFEPGLGNDENPWRQPIPYVQKIRGAINNFFQLEEPFGESLFPGASVGYSRVVVRDLDENGNSITNPQTGQVVNEFYTSKDFPVITRSTPNKSQQYGPVGWYSLFGSSSVHEMTFSQGYVIELNDMHGKPKATRIFNKAGGEISSTVYHYNAEAYNTGESRLKNIVTTVNDKGELQYNQTIGQEVELFTDMREQESNSTGQMIAHGVDVFPLPFFGVPAALPHWPYKQNDSYRLFRSACTFKVIQYYGIVDKVVKTVDGSSVSSENIAYDELTGEAVITRTQNEFERPIYSVNIPAYWIHPGMGAAYKNLGTVIPGLKILANGELANTGPDQLVYELLYPGDELINFVNNQRLWVIESAINGTGLKVKRVVDKFGMIAAAGTIKVKVLRSGYRNSLTPPGTSMVCLKDPVQLMQDGTRRIAFTDDNDKTAWQVLTASTLVYDEYWGMKNECATCPTGYQLLSDGNTCELIMQENTSDCFILCAGAVATGYGTNGANITTPGGIVNVKNDYYGGNCTGCGTLVTQPPVTTQSTFLVAPLAVINTCPRNNYMPNNPCGPGLCGKLNRTGVWLCTNPDANQDWLPINQYITVETCVDFPVTGTYFFGYAADDYLRIYLDGVLQHELTANVGSNFDTWHVKPTSVTAGKHTIRLVMMNRHLHGAIGLEIYNEPLANMLNPVNINPANIIFSTARDLAGKKVQLIKGTDNAGNGGTPRFTVNGTNLPAVCDLQKPVNRVINPYVKGFKGNWRTKEAKAFLVNRKYKDNLVRPNNTAPIEKEVDIKNAGNLDPFRPYWVYNSTDKKWKPGSDVSKWITTNTVTLYDKYGQELENKDALDRYSGAIFVFNGQLPGAVANNAMNREIFYESFEDVKFRVGCSIQSDSCNPQGLRENTTGKPPATVSNNIKHTGNYSAIVPPSGLSLLTNTHEVKANTVNYLTPNSKGEFALARASESTGIYPNGFEPFLPEPSATAKEYVFSVWVHDGQPATLTPGITASVNGTPINLTRKAVVEKWKLVEGLITINPSMLRSTFNLEIQASGGNVRIDDVRIHPFDSHLKSYAYDEKTLRLMAELDENNFATFYEYDDEGGLVRLKKETERGIMTIKENRSARKK